MSHRHAICLVVDGLRASALGAYGNTSYPTPQLDTLASRALVADWLWADSPHLAGFYRSAWQGRHALRPAVADPRDSVLDQLQKAGVRQWLVTDDPWLAEQASHLPFDDALLFENEAALAALRLDETTLARFFSEAIQRLEQWRDDVADVSSLAWLHCRGMTGPWDAPLEMRADLLDDEDPSPPEFVEPPMALRGSDDPDVFLAHRVAYAAQIKVLDACVGAFVQAVEEAFAGSETLITLTGSRGFALGEHGSVGTDCAELFSERLHVPWLLYPCGNTTPLPRLATLVQPADVGATVLEWLGVQTKATQTDGISVATHLRGVGSPTRQLVATGNDHGELAVRTPAWLLRQSQPATDDHPLVELFTKPDDRWESNDVAGLCGEVVDGLQHELTRFAYCCRENRPLPVTLQNQELSAPRR